MTGTETVNIGSNVGTADANIGSNTESTSVNIGSNTGQQQVISQFSIDSEAGGFDYTLDFGLN